MSLSTHENHQNSSADLNLKLLWDLRNELISYVFKLSSHLNGLPIAAYDVKALIEQNSNLIQRLSILQFDNNNPTEPHLKPIDESLLRNLNRNDNGLYVQLKSSTRLKIVGVLMRNFNSIVLFGNNICDQDRHALLDENNKLIHLLTDLKVKPYRSDLVADKNHKIRECEETIDGYLVKRIRVDDRKKMADLIEKTQTRLSELEQKIEDLDKQKEDKDEYAYNNEITFSFKVRKIKEFLKSEKSHYSKVCNFLSIPWYLKVKPNNLIDDTKYLEFYLCVEKMGEEYSEDWAVKVDFDLKLLHPYDDTLNHSYSLKNELFLKDGGWGADDYLPMDQLTDYVKDDSITFAVKIREERVYIIKNVTKCD